MTLPRIALYFALIAVAPAYAQRGGGHGGGGFGGARSGGGFGAGHAGGSGSRMGGFQGGSGFRGGFSGRSFRGGFGDGRFRGGFRSGAFVGYGGYWGYPYWGWSYPFYGYGGLPYAYGSSPYYYDPYYSDYGYVSQPYRPAPPEPISHRANQSSYRPPDFYLIAFTDYTIQAAASFSIDGDTIRWTTREHIEKSAPLSTVDRRFSEELNRDRHVEFSIP